VGYSAHNNAIVISHGSFAGDYYTYIPESSWRQLLAILQGNYSPSKEMGVLNSLTSTAPSEKQNETPKKVEPGLLVVLLCAHFSGRKDDPYSEIESFLTDNEVPFKSEYWTGDR
jgi:hypothetical protein